MVISTPKNTDSAKTPAAPKKNTRVSKPAFDLSKSLAQIKKTSFSDMTIDFDKISEDVILDDMQHHIDQALVLKKSPAFVPLYYEGKTVDFLFTGRFEINSPKTNYFEPTLSIAVTIENEDMTKTLRDMQKYIVYPKLTVSASTEYMFEFEDCLQIVLKFKVDENFLNYFDQKLADKINQPALDKFITSMMQLGMAQPLRIKARFGIFVNLVDSKIGFYNTVQKISL
jgi:hypothetical protein